MHPQIPQARIKNKTVFSLSRYQWSRYSPRIESGEKGMKTCGRTPKIRETGVWLDSSALADKWTIHTLVERLMGWLSRHSRYPLTSFVQSSVYRCFMGCSRNLRCQEKCDPIIIKQSTGSWSNSWIGYSMQTTSHKLLEDHYRSWFGGRIVNRSYLRRWYDETLRSVFVTKRGKEGCSCDITVPLKATGPSRQVSVSPTGLLHFVRCRFEFGTLCKLTSMKESENTLIGVLTIYATTLTNINTDT